MNEKQKKKVSRIAIVSSSFPPSGGGGVSTSHFNLFCNLKSNSFTVKAFTFKDARYIPELPEEDIVRTGLPSFLIKLINRIIFSSFRLIGQKGGVWQFAGTVTGALAGFLLRNKIRRFHPDILVLPDHGACGLFLPRYNSCKTVLISHNNPARFIGEPLFGELSEMDVNLALKLEQIVLKKVDGVICPSTYMKDVFSKTYSFRGPVAVIPNMVDFAMIEQVSKSLLHKKVGLAEDAPIIYLPSAGSVYKGSKFIFEIIRRLAFSYEKAVGFYLSGDIGRELSRMLEFVPSNAQLITPGQIPYKENIANIKSCSFCVSPTLVESFGMAILEAHLCSLPVVAFDVGGDRDILKEGETGYLVPFMDIERLIGWASKLLGDRVICVKMGDEAKRHSLKYFDPESLRKQYVAFFEGL